MAPDAADRTGEAQGALPAGSLAGAGVSPVAVAYSGLSAPIVRAEVALATAEELAPVVGSFTEGDMAFAIQPDGTATLVAVGPDAAPEEAGDGASTLSIPASVEHDGAAYEVAAIGAHAFSLCGAATVAIPASVASIDEDALWPTAAERVEVDPSNPTYASYDGILYDATLSRLLSIPEGRQGAVRIIESAQEVEASALSHSVGVDALCADAGGAHLASWDGLLYTADGTTLLRVPAGATSITIRDGCTTIAAGSMEGCSALERIVAPASIASVSSCLFEQEVRNVVGSAIAGDAGDEGKAAESLSSQLSSVVTLQPGSNGLPAIDPKRVTVVSSAISLWEGLGFDVQLAEGSDARTPTLLPAGSLPGADSPDEEAGVATQLNEAQSYDAAPITCYRKFDRMLYYDARDGAAGGTVTGPHAVDDVSAIGSWHAITPPLRFYSYLQGRLWVSGYENPNSGTSYSYINNNRGAGSIVYYGTNTSNLTRMPDQNAWVSVTQPMYFWFPAVYTATLDAGTGCTSTGSSRFHAAADIGLFSDDACRVSTTSIVVPTKSNATFLGYYTETGARGTQVVSASGAILKDWRYFANELQDDVTLYAAWSYVCQRQSDEVLYYSANNSSWAAPVHSASSNWGAINPSIVGYSYLNNVLTLKGSDGIDYAYYASNTKGTHAAVYAGTSPSSLTRLTARSYTVLSAPMYFQFPGVYRVTLDRKVSAGTASFYEMKGKGFYSNAACTTALSSVMAPSAATGSYSLGSFVGYYTEDAGGGSLVIDASGAIKVGNSYFSADATLYALWSFVCQRQSDELLCYTRSTDSSGTVLAAQAGSPDWMSISPAAIGYSYADGALTVKCIDGISYTYCLMGGAKHVAVYAGTSQGSLSRLSATPYTALSAPMYFQFPGVYRVTLDSLGASNAGTAEMWELKGKGFYSNAACTNALTSIATPTKESGTFYGYYTETNGEGTLVAGSAGNLVASPSLFSSDSTVRALWGYACLRQSDKDLWYVDSRMGDNLYYAQGGSSQWNVASPDMKGYSYQDGRLTVHDYQGISYTYCLAGGDAHPLVRVGTSPDSLRTLGATPYAAITEPLYFQFPGSYQATFVPGDDAVLDMAEPRVTVTMGSSNYCSYGYLCPRRDGYAFVGWFDEEGNQAWQADGLAVEGKYWSGDGVEATWTYPGDVTLYARWASVISAVVPVRVTATVDLFGIEDQVPGAGYIESRSGGALEVVAMDFEPLEGATELFGEWAPSVWLEALAGEGASTPDVRFSLGGARVEQDAAALAPFALPGGFGSRVPVSYRFDIPDDALGAIDAGRFDGATTPACSVAYTVALA